MPYESLIYALLSKEQTKLCCNSLRRALMQDWISGEESWSSLIYSLSTLSQSSPRLGGSDAELSPMGLLSARLGELQSILGAWSRWGCPPQGLGMTPRGLATVE